MPPETAGKGKRMAPLVRTDLAEAPSDAAEMDSGLAEHLVTVLSVSSGMVGVCLTAIGLIGIMRTLNRTETAVDDMLAVATLLFAVACLLSFFGPRTRLRRAWRRFALTLDVVFCLGMVLVVAATVMFTWVVF